MQNLEDLADKRNFETTNFAFALVRRVGSGADLDMALQTSPDSDSLKELLEGRFHVLTKTDFPPFMSASDNRRTYYYNNPLSAQLGGNYENRVFVQPAKDWCLATFKTVADNYELLIEGLGPVEWADLPITWEMANPRYLVMLKTSEKAVLEPHPLSAGVPDVSERLTES